MILWRNSTLSGNIISNNTTARWGGGVFVDADTTISDNTFTSNAAVKGGGLYVSGWPGDNKPISGNTFISNTADEGGGLYLLWYNSTLINNVVADNQTNIAGSGLYIASASPTLLHTTIAHNRGGDGSGVYVTDVLVYKYRFRSDVALINTIEDLKDLKDDDPDINTGINIVRRALEEPMRQLALNAGKEGAIVIEEVRRQHKTDSRVGYNLLTDEYVDMVKAGIIDPAKVTRSAVENAASIAAMILTTEALITDIPEPEPPMPPGGAGGMGGMM